MIIAQSYKDLLKKNKKLVFIDVRSPKEYKEAHIPEAINIPVFSDSEREKIGTMYKEQGKKEAIKEALKTVGPKVYDIYMEMDKHIEKNSELVVYCARGGMRSSTVVSLFKEFSLPVVKLLKGYKGYRQYLNENDAVLRHLTIQTKHAVTEASPMMKEEKSKNLLNPQQQEAAEA